jgi:zinc transporter 2
MTAEIIGGWLANSLAIMTDAAHLLSDLLGFLLSIFALKIGQNNPTKTLSYGYQRAEVIGALTSIILIWGLTIWLIYEAVLRVIKRPDVDG